MYPMLLVNRTRDGEVRKTDFKYTDEIDGQDVFLLSGRDEGESEVKSGDFGGLGINEVLKKIYGDTAELPICIKYVNTLSRLPVKVYPGESEGGKVSLIYITDATDGAEMVYGLARDVSRDELIRRASGGSLSAVCNFVSVQKGDVFFVPAGVIFAVGSGVSAIDISTTKGKEYIISNYGAPNRYNINRAAEVISNKKINIGYGTVGDITLYPFGTVREIGSCEDFSAEEITMNGNAGFYEDEKTASAIIVSGEIDLSYSTGTVHLKAGDSLLFPPKVKARLSGKATIIYTKF